MALQLNTLTPAEELEEYKRLIATWPAQPESALPALQALSDAYGPVPDMAIEALSDYLSVPVAKLYAMVTFYDTLAAETGDTRTVRQVKSTPSFDTCAPLRKAHPLEQHLLLADIQTIDPESIESYREHGGYEGLARALELGPAATIAEVTASGLRGKGGAGYPTGRKWASAAAAPGPCSVICNGNEGDPATCVDRFLLEHNPHAVIEGLAIAALATGAERGWLYIRDEYALARQRVQRALDAAYGVGILGASVMGSGHALELSVVRAGGTFVCGESTALMNTVEGRIGEPRAHYTHTVEHGLYDRPTVLNNVETLAAVPLVLRDGAAAFATVGTPGSGGTKLFNVTGDVERPGIYEVPFGTTLRELVDEIAGGPAAGHELKALHPGGPCEGFATPDQLDCPIDFDAFKERGIAMGSGGLEVLDERCCIPATSLSYLEFLCGQSCGKCTPCREGLRQMRAIVTGICTGTGSARDLDTLQLLGETMSDASLCALGRSAASPVLSSLGKFRDEWEAHILQGRCPAGMCALDGTRKRGGAA